MRSRREDHAREGGSATARRVLRGLGETYKAEWISRDPEETRTISLYRQGNFVDLCVGPHLPSTGKLGHAFKLMKVAGAYWRGDARNAAPARLRHGLGERRRSSTQYLFPARRGGERDHRRLAASSISSTSSEEAVGAVFWHPKGWTLYRTIENLHSPAHRAPGYRSADAADSSTARCGKRRATGRTFGEYVHGEGRGHGRVLAIKPMNCPGHVQIFRQGLHSLSRICRCVWPNSAAAIAMSRRARCTASCACAASPRTTRISSAPKTRSPAGSDLVLRIAAIGLPRFRLRRRLASNSPTGRRCAPAPTRSGTGRGGAEAAVEAAGCPIRSIRARAPFMGRSSNSCSATRWAANGNAARFSSISSCRGGSEPSMSARMARAIRRLCCTGPSSARSSALSPF